jgi:hypothetical protein
MCRLRMGGDDEESADVRGEGERSASRNKN